MSGDQRLTFGELLRHHRQAAGLTQAELAERAGLSVRGINDLERGVRQAPRKDTVSLLAQALGLSDAERADFATAARRSTAPAAPVTSTASPLPAGQGDSSALALPKGTVTFLFTDIEGSTRLLQHLGADRYAQVRAEHERLLRAAFTAHDGREVDTQGDSFFVVFPTAHDALAAAAEAQRALAAQNWPDGGTVHVRVGLHTGTPILTGDRYVGLDVHRAARIAAAGHGGQVLLSEAARVLAEPDLPEGATLRDLGTHRLKDLQRPEHLWQLVLPNLPGLPVDFPPLATLDAYPHNLPIQPTPLVGRSADLAALVELVRDARVITITGPGGVGKTRLLAELGRLLAHEFLDGVAFIPMADITNPTDFLPALAQALDVKEAEGRTLGQGVVSLLGDKRALLLLDNLEQVVAAAPEVARLVASCPHLRIATTSRTPLRIAVEREYPLAPLALPVSDLESAESLMEYSAIALFVERARATKGSFALTGENAGAVVAVCRRLDGLPLALELAAARLRLLSPQALLERLDHALNVLTTGSRDRPVRHQTLRAAIDWSHALLTDAEQRLFRRLAVFVGGCTVADVETVCADPGVSSLDELESLVDNALLQVDGQGDRLRLLQTIGEYARERLADAGETDAITLRHAQRYAALARDIRDGIEGSDQVGSLDRGITEEGNLQAALDTFLARAQGGDMTAVEAGMHLCGDLYMYWHIRGKNLTAREYATSFLAADTGGSRTVGRAGALRTAGLAWWVLGEFAHANDLWAESYQIAEDLQDERERCVAAFVAGLGLLGFDLDTGLRRTAESIERSQHVGFAWAQGFALTADGILHTAAGDLEAARASYSQALAIQQHLGDREGAGLSLGGLAALAAGRGDLADALDRYGQARAAFASIGDRAEEARILAEMGWTSLRHQDAAHARRSFLDSVRAYTEVASVRGVGLALIGLAATESAEHQPERAVQIAAAAEVYAHKEGIVNVYSEETPGRTFIDQARAALPVEQVARAMEIGRRLTIKQTLDLARNVDATSAQTHSQSNLLADPRRQPSGSPAVPPVSSQ
jgi:predicted ATPase/class 3 adenylate cyclase